MRIFLANDRSGSGIRKIIRLTYSSKRACIPALRQAFFKKILILFNSLLEGMWCVIKQNAFFTKKVSICKGSCFGCILIGLSRIYLICLPSGSSSNSVSSSLSCYSFTVPNLGDGGCPALPCFTSLKTSSDVFFSGIISSSFARSS